MSFFPFEINGDTYVTVMYKLVFCWLFP